MGTATKNKALQLILNDEEPKELPQAVEVPPERKKGRKPIPDSVKTVVKGLLESGLTYNEIAVLGQKLPTTQATIAKISKDYDANKEIVNFYSNHKRDLIVLDQVCDREAANEARDALQTRIERMDDKSLVRFYVGARTSQGILYDKLRLEDDKSTENVSVIHTYIKTMKRKKDAARETS